MLRKGTNGIVVLVFLFFIRINNANIAARIKANMQDKNEHLIPFPIPITSTAMPSP